MTRPSPSRSPSPRRLTGLRLTTAALAAAVALVVAGCNQCGAPPKREAHDDDRITAKTDRPALEVSPLPQPPVIAGVEGMLPGIPKGPLTVVVARPQDQLRGNERPSITFNKPVVPLGALDADMPSPATIAPEVKGTWRWIGSSAAEFMPAAPFPYATMFTVTVKPDLKAIDGEGMTTPRAFTFSTLAPRLDRSVPQSDWSWLDPTQPLKLVFNQPVKNLEKAKLTADGKAVSFSVGAAVDVEEEAAKKAGRRPEGRTPWGKPTRYELKLPSMPAGVDVRLDLDGVVGAEGPVGLADGSMLSFRTRGPMVVKSVAACGRYNEECTQGPVVFETSNDVDLDSLVGKVHIKRRGDNDAKAAHLHRRRHLRRARTSQSASTASPSTSRCARARPTTSSSMPASPTTTRARRRRPSKAR